MVILVKEDGLLLYKSTGEVWERDEQNSSL